MHTGVWRLGTKDGMYNISLIMFYMDFLSMIVFHIYWFNLNILLTLTSGVPFSLFNVATRQCKSTCVAFIMLHWTVMALDKKIKWKQQGA